MNENPLITFALFAYNQERYIRKAVEAALNQDYSPLEIIISDDCSTDRTFEIISEIIQSYKGNHIVRINKNKVNLGLIGHVNYMFEIAKGEIIVVAAGDDISLPNRVSYIVNFYLQNNKPLLIHSSVIKINDNNENLGIAIPPIIEESMALDKLADCTGLYFGAAGAWSKKLYQEFGPIIFENTYEDLVLGFRAALKNSILFIDTPLIQYRTDVGISAKSNLSVFKLMSKIQYRIKIHEITLNVYKQRLADINYVKELSVSNMLKSRLLRNISLQENKILFYQNPFGLFTLMFTREFIIVLKSIRCEIKYLMGLE